MFGDQLKKARVRKGYTLEELADTYNKAFKGKISKGTLSKYEHNKQEPMISVVDNLSTLLGVSADYLLSKTSGTNDFSLLSTGEKIKLVREGKGISIDALSEVVGVAKSVMQGYENGTKKIPVDMVPIIERVLNMPAGYFMDCRTLQDDEDMADDYDMAIIGFGDGRQIKTNISYEDFKMFEKMWRIMKNKDKNYDLDED